MEKRRLGSSSLEIAPLVFGGNVLGWTVDEKTGFLLLDEFVHSGFNCIDTADVYSAWVPGHKGGESETIIGNWLKRSGKRKDVLIATKAGYGMSGNKNDLSKKYILSAVESSLKRLQTDYIDLYQAHVDDPGTPQEETLEAFTALVRSGKVRAIGCSNFSAERLEAALGISKEKTLAAYCSLQPEYNLYDREKYERELQPVCIRHNVGVIPYFPLAAGFLTGKYRNEKDTEGKARGARVKKYFTERGSRILEALGEVAKKHNSTPAGVALAWILHQPGITAPIASATSPEQLRNLMEGVQLRLTHEDLEKLNIKA